MDTDEFARRVVAAVLHPAGMPRTMALGTSEYPQADSKHTYVWLLRYHGIATACLPAKSVFGLAYRRKAAESLQHAHVKAYVLHQDIFSCLALLAYPVTT